MLYDDVVKLYVALFDRAPEKEGFEGWYKATLLNDWDRAKLAQSMIAAAQEYLKAHPEDRDIYPQYVDLDERDFSKVQAVITKVYEILFNKSYSDDPEGIDTWTQSVVDGEPLGNVIASIVTVADEIAAGNIPADQKTLEAAQAFENKVSVSKYAIEKFDTFNGDFYFFQNIIKEVDASSSSIEHSIDQINGDTDYQVPLTPSVEALLYGEDVRLPQQTITYSFDQQMPQEYANYSDLIQNWQPLGEEDRQVAREVFAYADSLLGVSFQEVPSGGDIRISKSAMSSANEAGFTMVQEYNGKLVSEGIGSDIFLALDYDNKAAAKDVILHELGHALGLKHPFEGDIQLPISKDDTLYTIMSYTQVETALPQITLQKTSDTSYSYLVTMEPVGRQNYGYYDIQALQYLYGVEKSHLGNEEYDLSQSFANHSFPSIIDFGGIEWLDFSNSSDPIKIDLIGGDRLGSIGEHLPYDFIKEQVEQQVQEQQITLWSSEEIYDQIINTLSNSSEIYQGKEVVTLRPNSIENIKASQFDDVIYDNALDNIILTGAGDDIIYVNGGNDYIDGGAGYDKLYLDLLPEENYQKIIYNDVTYLIFDEKVVALENIEEIAL